MFLHLAKSKNLLTCRFLLGTLMIVAAMSCIPAGVPYILFVMTQADSRTHALKLNLLLLQVILLLMKLLHTRVRSFTLDVTEFY